jgi:segregation and condensation protein B
MGHPSREQGFALSHLPHEVLDSADRPLLPFTSENMGASLLLIEVPFLSRARLLFMSLKAKLEAVVYAAEEPVTLAQLAVIFADEVLPLLNQAAEPEAEQIALEGLAAEADAPAAAPEPADSGAENGAAPEESPIAAEAGEEKKAARVRDRQVRQFLQQVLNELIADYSNNERGMEIREIAGGYRMATKPEYHDAVRGFVKGLKPPMKLSLQALETLAVIAYKQPVTAPEVSEIRGVDSGGVLGGLVSRKLITTAGRKPVIGRPILYKTTKEFLLRFGLKDVNDLPSMEEFEKMAGELAESEAEGDAQDAVNLSSAAATPAEEAAPVAVEAAPVEAEPPSAESSEEVAAASEEGTPSPEEAPAEPQTEHQV